MKNQDDLVAAGFHRLDDKAVNLRAPRIKWGTLYEGMTDARKIEYLERVASTMNHAAAVIEEERNELGRLCELKESQIEKLSKAMAQNNHMLQSEVARMNSDRQEYNESFAKIQKENRELKRELLERV